MNYTLTITEFGVNVADQDGKQLSSDEIKRLAENLLQMVEPQPNPLCQLVLFDGKKRKKPEKTEDEKRIAKRTQELVGLIARLRNLTPNQLILDMDELMCLLPTIAPSRNITAGKEGVGAKRIAQSGDWTDRQVVACYKWLKMKKFAGIPLSLQTICEWLPEYDKQIKQVQSRRTANPVIDTQRKAAYQSVEMDVSF